MWNHVILGDLTVLTGQLVRIVIILLIVRKFVLFSVQSIKIKQLEEDLDLFHLFRR